MYQTMIRYRGAVSFIKSLVPTLSSAEHEFCRFSTSSTNRIKEIVITKNGKQTIFEGKITDPPWAKYELKSAVESTGACSLCSTNLDVKHTDVLILRQFLRSDGCMLPRRVTGLCKTQQKRVSYMVTMAKKAGLMLRPGKETKDRSKWKQCNTYFDESTIRLPAEYYKKHVDLNKLV